ncbi:TPA: hypothetical protein N0F65_010384 [Lagenidium giganteum]|uniref:Uncharacterized protein n=1 Tax=Lagenidium giganteum TaxID=4803 RepID=A0AAV2YJ95_9STRA|nr:TPA: hypothetical protein N0F65_010384 [Lagenidium giganteum]
MHINGPQTRKEVAIARATCVLVGTFLNAVSCMGVPTVLFGAILLQYNDVYFARIVTESPMIAAGTMMELFIKATIPTQKKIGITAVIMAINPAASESASGVVSTETSSTRRLDPFPPSKIGRYLTTITHASTRRSAHDSLCDLVVAPWFATKFPCLVYTFDCDALSDATARDGYLSFLDEQVLRSPHTTAPSLSCPPTSSASNLLGIN